MRYAISLLLAVCLMASVPVSADPARADEAGSDGSRADKAGPVLVELYTSQGCSYCPPADAFLEELAARNDVIALALHVDYWDYIYADIFGKAAFTERQYGYAAADGRKMVYTPQMIIGGQEQVIGNRSADINALIKKQLSQPAAVALKLLRDGADIWISAEADRGLSGPLIVLLARYIPQKTVTIERGENAGRTSTYVNIVTDLAELGSWDTAQPLMMKLPAPGELPMVVILQQPGYGKVEAAALLR